MRQIYETLIEPYSTTPPRSDNEGLMRACEVGTYSYICTQVTVWGLAKGLPCILEEIPDAYFSVTVSMIMQKSSPFKKIFSSR